MIVKVFPEEVDILELGLSSEEMDVLLERFEPHVQTLLTALVAVIGTLLFVRKKLEHG